MKHHVALITILLTSPAMLAAQSGSSAPADGRATNSITITKSDGKASKTMIATVPQHSACPVAMQAKQGSGAGLVAVRIKPGQPDNRPSVLDNKPGQQIHLTLGKIPGAQFDDLELIASATVTARGLSARGRLDSTPAVIGGPSSDLRRTLDVRFTAENDGGAYADLDLPGFTSVQSIRIDSIALKDGSKWTFATRQGCVATPDPLMLIATH